MSRVSLLEQLYSPKIDISKFNYDMLSAPSIRSILSQQDINDLYKIATSLKYSANIDKKYELINNIMRQRGFRKSHCGTNRMVFEFLDDPRFVAKVAIDRVGISDSPAEYKIQKWLKPFCCKIFEVDPTGVISFVERVNPITSIEEFSSVAEDVFNMMISKIIGKLVLDDVGETKFMNYGIRKNFGPVLLDFPYAYKLDGNKLICRNQIDTPFGKSVCNGEIDYDAGLNYLACTKCGKRYQARDLAKPETQNQILILNEEGSDNNMARAYITKGDEIIKDSKPTTKTYISEEQYDSYNNTFELDDGEITINKIVYLKSKRKQERGKNMFYNRLVEDTFGSSEKGAEAKIVSANKKIECDCNFDIPINHNNNGASIVYADEKIDEEPEEIIIIEESTEEEEPEVKEESVEEEEPEVKEESVEEEEESTEEEEPEVKEESVEEEEESTEEEEPEVKEESVEEEEESAEENDNEIIDRLVEDENFSDLENLELDEDQMVFLRDAILKKIVNEEEIKADKIAKNNNIRKVYNEYFDDEGKSEYSDYIQNVKAIKRERHNNKHQKFDGMDEF